MAPYIHGCEPKLPCPQCPSRAAGNSGEAIRVGLPFTLAVELGNTRFPHRRELGLPRLDSFVVRRLIVGAGSWRPELARAPGQAAFELPDALALGLGEEEEEDDAEREAAGGVEPERPVRRERVAHGEVELHNCEGEEGVVGQQDGSPDVLDLYGFIERSTSGFLLTHHSSVDYEHVRSLHFGHKDERIFSKSVGDSGINR